MANFASRKPTSDAASDRLSREIAEITAIYSRLYRDRHLQIILFEGSNPVWSAPSITEQDITIAPHILNGDYIGTVQVPGPHPAAPVLTVTISIPRNPSQGELDHPEPIWQPNRRLARLFAVSPLAYEQIRHIVEMRRKKASAKHIRPSLWCGRGAPDFVPQRQPVPGKRPAIIVGVHWLEVGGAEKLAFDSIQWAVEAGLRVFVVASVAAFQRLQHKLPQTEDVTFIRLDRYLPHSHWPRFLQKLVEDENVILVHNHHCVPLYDALPQLRLHTPWVTVIDSTHIIEYANGGYPRISGVWSNFIDHHHVISGELVRYMRDTFGVLGKVHLGRMRDRAQQTGDLPPPNMSAGKKALHVTFIGRLSFQKRPIVVVETFRALDAWARKNGIALTGTLVGEGPFQRGVEALLNRYGLADRVERVAATSDVPALLKRSDILILPSNNEGLALVCYEAVEHGCIPISTDVGSQSEIVPEGLLVPLASMACVRETVRVVDRLWRDEAFLAAQHAALNACHHRLAADPTAEEVISGLYRQTLARIEAEDEALGALPPHGEGGSAPRTNAHHDIEA
ncbi:glycosyltransferase [Cereibacter sphaeroides]|nr:glycosyltransferase [Cereibacter sphaeroides]